MFTGIVKYICPVTSLVPGDRILSLQIEMDRESVAGLQRGASVAIDGVCLTVVDIEGSKVWFDLIEETLIRTSLKKVAKGDLVNVERSARFGDEIGGHLLSGHIYGTAEIYDFSRSAQQAVLTLSCPKEWTRYLFPKGFVALNGASLTLVDAVKEETSDKGLFSVHLIPETLRKTTFSHKAKGDLINVELDAYTQAVVDTVERVLRPLANKDINSTLYNFKQQAHSSLVV